MREKILKNGMEYGVRITAISTEDEKSFNGLLIDLANQDKEFYNKRSSFLLGNK